MSEAPGRRRRATVRRAVLLAVGLLAPPLALLAVPPVLPEGPGKSDVERACAQCHSLEVLSLRGRTHRQWESVLDTMIARGAKVSDAEFDTIADYLTLHFAPAKAAEEPASP